MYLFKFLLSMHFFGGVIIPFFTDWGQISFFQIMILQSIFMISIVLFEVPTGAIADYFGRRITLLFAALSAFIGVIVYSWKPDFLLFICGEILWSLAFSLLSGAEEAMIYDTLQEIDQETKSKKAFSRYKSFEIAGYMVSAPIGPICQDS